MDFGSAGKIEETYTESANWQSREENKGGGDCFLKALSDRETWDFQEKDDILPRDKKDEALGYDIFCRKRRRTEEELRQMWKEERARRRRRAEYFLLAEEAAWKRKFQWQENMKMYAQGTMAVKGGAAAYEAGMLMRPIRKNRLSKV